MVISLTTAVWISVAWALVLILVCVAAGQSWADVAGAMTAAVAIGVAVDLAVPPIGRWLLLVLVASQVSALAWREGTKWWRGRR